MSEPLGKVNPLNNPQCTARSKRSGERCKRPAMNGTTVCRNHGGAAPQVQRKARQRLEEASDRMARALLEMAESGESEAVKLAAIKDALDRGGLKAPTSVDLSVEAGPKPWEQLVTGMSNATRAESRARRGIEEPTMHYSLPSSHSGVEVIDVEATENPTENRPSFAADDLPRSGGVTGPDGPSQPGNGQMPGDQLMTIEEANEVLARQRRGLL